MWVFSRRFQADLGGPGPPGGPRRLQAAPGAGPPKTHHKHALNEKCARRLPPKPRTWARLNASANKTEYIWAFKGVCGAFTSHVFSREGPPAPSRCLQEPPGASRPIQRPPLAGASRIHTALPQPSVANL